MRSGISRKINAQGRVVIPKCVRNDLHIEEGDSFDVLVQDDDTIVLKKKKPVVISKEELDSALSDIKDEAVREKIRKKFETTE